MIRITTADEPTSITITVDGKLTRPYTGPVESCCTEATTKGKPVRLFLREVSAIDECGCALLRHLAAKGVLLRAAGIYNSYVVEVCTRAAEAPLIR